MKMRKVVRVLTLAWLAALCARAAFAAEPDGQLALPEFKNLEARASQAVNISLDASLIGLAARFLDSNDPNEAAVRQVISGLTGIYVRSYTFDNDFTVPKEEVDRVRRQLEAPPWQRVVQVHDTRQHEDVDIYMRVDAKKADGLAIIASEPREFTIVNLVGSIDLQKLHELEGHFGIPKLKLDAKNKPPSTP
jgi:hypothetical protein